MLFSLLLSTRKFTLVHFACCPTNPFLLLRSDTGFHPFHLHGHEFQVVNKAMDYLSNDTELNPPIDESQVNPVRRDTVTVPPGGSTTIRWRADNPGAWLFHCHVDWHHTQGAWLSVYSTTSV